MAVHHPGRGQNLRDLQRAVKQMVTQAMQNASFGSAGLRVYGGGWINIENGGLRVIGTAIVTGRLEGSGTLDWTGPVWLRGPVMIPGNLTGVGRLLWSGSWELRGYGQITGDMNVTGSTRLLGKTTLENDLEVLAGGKIRVGKMIIDASHSGTISFPNGAYVRAEGESVTVSNGVSAVDVSHDSVKVTSGGVGLEVSGSGIRVNPIGVPTLSGTGLYPGTLVLKDGRIHRATN